MPGFGDIAVIVLAAGQGRRFGSDKLMADLDGCPMGLHVAKLLAEMPFGWRLAVCSKATALSQRFSKLGFATIENTASDLGQSHSLHLAVEAAQATEARAILMVLADMPFVTKSHIEQLLAAGEGIVASTSGHHPMPPALFPREFWPRLMETTGDAGARDLLCDATLIHAAVSELRDIDLADDLRETRTQ